MIVVFALLLATLGALTPPRFRWPVVGIYAALLVAFVVLDSCVL